MQEFVEELKDIQERLLRAHDKGAQSLVEESNALAEADRAVNAVLEWPSTIEEAVDRLEKTLPAPALAKHSLVPTDLPTNVEKLEAALTRSIRDIRSAIEEAAEAMKAHSADWQENHQDERHRIQSELADAGIANPEELDVLQRRRAELANLVENQQVAVRRKKELTGQRGKHLTALSDVRRRKSRLTENAARELTGRVGNRVRIKTNPLADRSHLLALFEDHLRGQSVRKAQLGRLAESLPSAIGAAILEGPGALEALGCSPATASKVAQLPPSVARACEECDIPDQVMVEINLGTAGAANWTPV